jgi:hypothetical protein
MRCLHERAPRLGQVVHRLRHDTSESGATDIQKLPLISTLIRGQVPEDAACGGDTWRRRTVKQVVACGGRVP